MDYNRLIHIAGPIYAISGDNTLEKALSHDKLPYLQSTKYKFEQFITELFRLSKKYVPDMSAEMEEQFSKYFANKNMRLDNELRFEALLAVDWDKMHKIWIKVTDGIRRDYNINNHLEAIFYEALLHASAQNGDVALLQIIHQNAPKIDLTIPNKNGETALSIAQKEKNPLYLR